MPQGPSDAPAPVRKLAALISEYPDGIKEADLLTAARARFGRAPPRTAALLHQAVQAGLAVRHYRPRLLVR